MPYCWKCGTNLDEDYKFCPVCGTPVARKKEPMLCEYCGKEIPLPFECVYCGGTFCAEDRLPEVHQCRSMPKSPFWYQRKKLEEKQTKQESKKKKKK